MTPLGDEDAEEEERLDDERRRRWESWRDRSASVIPSREDSLAPSAASHDDGGAGAARGEAGGMTNLSQALMNVSARRGVGEGED